MTKSEFTQRLREALIGEIPDSVVEENICFYDRYISDEIAKGKSEKEVLESFGDPRLIAKTILGTWQSNDTDPYHTVQVYEEEQDSRCTDNGDSFVHMNGCTIRLDKWYMKLIPIVIIVLILAIVFFVIFGMMKLTFTVLTSPFFWGILLIFTVLGWFSRRR